MADIPEAPLEGTSSASTSTVPMLAMTEDDGASGLRAVLFAALRSFLVNAQRIGELLVGAIIADSTTALAAKTVGNTTTEILAAVTNRVSATFVNDSDETIYLAVGVDAVMNQGIRLNANGGSYEINFTNMDTRAVDAICASGGKNLCVHETHRA